MADNETQPGALPTESVTREQEVILVRSLLVDWQVLDHLHKNGIVSPELMREGCCKPDGGSCCVNKKP